MFSRLADSWNRARQKGLKACIRFAVERFDPVVGYPVGRMQYAYRAMRGEPYFGHFCAAGQGVAAGVHNEARKQEREANMRRLVFQACSLKEGNARILEVGSWAGWSAIVWAEALQECKQSNGAVVCVDPWKSYFDLNANRTPVYRAMEAATRKDAIVHLFYHNIRSAGHAATVHPLRGTSDCCLPMLRDGWFHLAFIDGDHSYAAAKRDLDNASRLVSDGGVLSGDDLDLQFQDLDEDHLRKNLHYDYPVDPKSKQGFHPGVTLAVWEFFGQRVSSWDGLWAMRKVGNGWKHVDLEAASAPAAAHGYKG
jgi:predicted O-methyltransferase YrrM